MIKEIWKNIPNFSKYQASTLGQIRNKKTQNIFKQTIKFNSCRVGLINNSGLHKTAEIQIFIAMAFLRKPNKDEIINHIDGVKTNNKLENLRIVTRSFARKDALKRGLIISKTKTSQIYKCDSDTKEIIETYNSAEIAGQKHGLSKVGILYRCKQGREGKSVKGFLWLNHKNIHIKVDNEIWKKFRKSTYIVSNHGHIKNDKDNFLKISFLKNYGRVKLVFKNQTQKHFEISRLVAEVFIPNPKNLPEVDHIDGNPRNNNVENLRWVTKKDNVRFAKAVSIDQLTLDNEFIKTWSCLQDAVNIYGKGVSACVNGRYSFAKGFKWRYTDPEKRKPEKVIQKIAIKVDQFTLDGKFVKRWPSIKEAERQLKIVNISSLLRGVGKSIGGFKWKYVDIYVKKGTNISKSIDQFTMQGKFIKTWPSIESASKKLNIVRSGISGCLNGSNKSSGNFKWVISTTQD